MQQKKVTIGIVAGEASGDLLGSHLMAALREARPDVQFIGIGGPRMKSAVVWRLSSKLSIVST